MSAVIAPIAVPRFDASSLAAVVAGNRPAVLVGLLEGEPRLSLAELAERWGERVVPSAPIVDGAIPYTPRGGVPYTEHTLQEVIASLDGPGDRMLTLRPEDHFPGVEPRLPALGRRLGAPFRRSRLWVSPPNAITPLHHELTRNLLAQLEGEKEVTLYSAWEWRTMYPNAPWSSMPHLSRVVAHRPDLSAHPRFARARPFRARLAPGDVLFIPTLWWHWVRAIDRSLSFNVWFADGLIARAARALELYKKARALRL